MPSNTTIVLHKDARPIREFASLLKAARHKERKFARSASAGRHAAYAARTGMFLP